MKLEPLEFEDKSPEEKREELLDTLEASEGLYVHLDLRGDGNQDHLSALAFRINTIMLTAGCVDPRIQRGFPPPTNNGAPWNATALRRWHTNGAAPAGPLGNYYYELWKCPPYFSFRQLFHGITNIIHNYNLRVVAILSKTRDEIVWHH